jgi:hypothetical protein
MESLLRKYGISLPVASQVFAAIDHEGHVLNGTDPAGATRMAELLRCDWRDFLISRQSVSMPKVILPAQPQRWR